MLFRSIVKPTKSVFLVNRSLSSVSGGKLFYSPTSCGAASFIAAHSAGVNLSCEQVNLKTHKTSGGLDFYTLNPKGNVPCILFKDVVLNENAAVLQYIADQAPGKIAPENGTMDRNILQNTLSYISSEVHPSIGGLFAPSLKPDVKDFIKGKAALKLTYLENTLIADHEFVGGSKSFTVADSYLYIVLSWTTFVGIDLAQYPKVEAYFKRVKNLPNVKEAHKRMAENPATIL